MTSSSHLASSALVYLAASALTESPVGIEDLAVAALGSLLPDIDTPTSSIGRPFYPLASWINQKVGHRTLTHSLLGLLLFGLLVVGGAWGWSRWHAEAGWLIQHAWLLLLGYTSHIMVDTLNKQGVELFWPARARSVFFYNEHYRIAAAGPGDYWFMTVCLVLNLGMYPVARDGFTRTLHRAFGDIYSVSMDFKQYGDKRRIWADLEGVEAISNQKVRGRFEVLAALDNGSVLIEREGVKQIVSRTEPLDIFPDRAAIAIGEEQRIRVEEIDMAGRTLGEIPRFAGASRVLLYGYLTPVELPPLSVHEGRYDPVSRRLDKVKLEHAEYRDLKEQDLEDLAIREGILLVKIFETGESPVRAVRLPPQKAPIRQIELRLGPTDELLVAEGDEVKLGQVIARKDISIQTEKLEADYRRDLETLNERLGEVERQIGAAGRSLREAEEEKGILEAEWAELRSQPLLGKEALRLERAILETVGQVEEAKEKIAALEARENRLMREMASRSERLGESIRFLQKQAEVRSSFGGRIARMESKPLGEDLLYSISYR